jgi:hypothetical protein
MSETNPENNNKGMEVNGEEYTAYRILLDKKKLFCEDRAIHATSISIGKQFMAEAKAIGRILKSEELTMESYLYYRDGIKVLRYREFLKAKRT